jgi:hypothetical protein
MPAQASGTLTANLVATALFAQDLGVITKADVPKILTNTFTSGVGLNQYDRIFIDERTIAGSGTDILDFVGGGLLDVLLQAWAPTRLKFLMVTNLGPNDIQLVRPVSNGIPIYLAAGDGELIPPNGFVVKTWPSATGIVVTGGTGDLLNVINTAAGTITYQIIAGGASA